MARGLQAPKIQSTDGAVISESRLHKTAIWLKSTSLNFNSVLKLGCKICLLDVHDERNWAKRSKQDSSDARPQLLD